MLPLYPVTKTKPEEYQISMIDWQQIRTVLLDMDGTLLDLHFDNHFWLVHLPRRFAEINAIPHDQAKASLLAKMDALQGKLDWYCLDFWSNELGIDIPSLKREIQHLIRFRPHVEDFLQALRTTGHRVVLVTNAHRKSLELKMERVSLAPYFDRIISSHDFKMPKEDPAFWSHVNDLEPFDPETTLLIDDSLAVLRSAREYGIRHLMTILVPDSQKPTRQQEDIDQDFLSIDHFNRVLPDNQS